MKQYIKYLCAILLMMGTSARAWAADATYYVWDSSANKWVEYVVQDENATVVEGPEASNGRIFVGWHVWNPDVYPNWKTTGSGYIQTSGAAYYPAGGESATVYVRYIPDTQGNTAVKNTGKNDSDRKLYAIYSNGTTDWNKNAGWSASSEDKVTITFDKNDAGASGTMVTQTVLKNTYTYLQICEFIAPDGKVFGGWATSPSGSVTYSDQGSIRISSNTTLYAIWIDECVDISGETVTVNDITPVWSCENNRWEITGSWDAVPGASIYSVSLQYSDNGGTWHRLGGVNYGVSGTSKTFPVDNVVENQITVVANRKWRVRVAAANQSCVPNTNTEWAYSNEVAVSCPTVTASGSATSITSTSATINWGATGTAGCYSTYIVLVKKHSDDSEVWETDDPTTSTSHSLTGLVDGTQYDVSILAENACGESDIYEFSFTTTKNYINYVYTCIDVSLIQKDGVTATPLYVTSAAGQKVKATRMLNLTIAGADANKDVTLSGTDLLFYKSDGTQITGSVLQTNASGEVDEDIYVAYAPSSYVSEIIATPTITVSCDGNNVPFTNLVAARCLPNNFVIASKLGDHWYALTANCASSGTYTGLLIAVDDEGDPSLATAPTEARWGMREVASGRYAANGTHMTFTERLTTETANNQKTLYNYTGTSLGLSAAWGSYGSAEYPVRYEWIPSSSDLKDYTLTSATTLAGDANARTLSLKTDGVFGTLLNSKSYSGQVRLLPAIFEDPAEMQIVEWKANSVVVMYTGSGVSATTQVGSNVESSAQTLTAKKIDHGVFELTTDQALTSNANKLLTLTIFNGSSGTVGSKIVTIPAIVSGAKNADALVADVATAATTDVVILDGATLSAVATKYTYNNITVYPGGKLIIGSGKQLGMASLNLRGGSSWGAATYQHKYPQFIVNNTTSGAYSNTSATINYDYVTTKDQYYSFVLPYNGSTSTIKYPVDIYGSAVSASNTGSFEFQYYDGAVRAAGGTGWKVLEEPADLVAGRGYTFLGMPKKVDAYDGTDDSHANTRQRYGIHRIPMSVSATTVQAGETNSSPGKSTPISVTLADKNNASGWVLVGNPFMGDVTGLSNTDIQVGNLIHSDTNPWDGKWRWNPESSQRFVVIPDNSGLSYSSEEVTTAELPAFKNFFVQIKSSSVTSLVIPASSRDDAGLAPARRIAQEEKDIRLAVDLVSDTKSDKVDFLINDTYSAAFDDDADFTKMMNGTNFNLYGVYPGDYLSFIAVDKTTAAGNIAIGYQVPATGEYTLQLSERPYVMSDYVETLLVTDHEVDPEVTTDLLENAYTFTVTKAEMNDTRFTISIKLKENQDTPTDIDIINGGGDLDSEKPIKFIYHDKMYILRNGVLYDATGKRVKEINK